MEKMTLEEFREYVKENDVNMLTHEEMQDKEFEDKFTIVCKKCGSMNIEFFGELGVDYGEYTGYAPGNNGFKCKKCGNAINWYQ
jgi:hypothetical protein